MTTQDHTTYTIHMILLLVTVKFPPLSLQFLTPTTHFLVNTGMQGPLKIIKQQLNRAFLEKN